MKKNKYRPGRIVRSWNSLMNEIGKGRYVYLGHKVQHPGWVTSMTVRSLNQYMTAGLIKKSKENK
jgi:hypothetical protein